MVHLTVYYNPSKDYDPETNENANVMVSIDGEQAIKTREANRRLFKDIVDKGGIPSTKGNAPVGIFHESGISYTMDDSTKCINNIKLINYKEISEESLERILRDRFAEVVRCLKEPVDEIKCIRDVPPI